MTEACRVCPARLVEDASQLFGGSLSDLVPPEAQTHLLNAQRELVLAVLATIEHHSARTRPPAKTARRRRGAAPATRRPSRVEIE